MKKSRDRQEWDRVDLKFFKMMFLTGMLCG